MSPKSKHELPIAAERSEVMFQPCTVAIELNNLGAELFARKRYEFAAESFHDALHFLRIASEQALTRKDPAPINSGDSAAAAIAKLKSLLSGQRVVEDRMFQENKTPPCVYEPPIKLDLAGKRPYCIAQSGDELKNLLDHESARVAFNMALSYHFLGNSERNELYFHKALTLYQLANKTASLLGYMGLAHMVRALLSNMAQIQAHIFGRFDLAMELLEEMNCVHELLGEGDE